MRPNQIDNIFCITLLEDIVVFTNLGGDGNPYLIGFLASSPVGEIGTNLTSGALPICNGLDCLTILLVRLFISAVLSSIFLPVLFEYEDDKALALSN